MEEPKQCLWCGGFFGEGNEGICRECWEKNQFPDDPTSRLGGVGIP